jgi:hypothetical protein
MYNRNSFLWLTARGCTCSQSAPVHGQWQSSARAKPYRHSTNLQKLARPPLAHLMFTTEMHDSFPLRSERHHFARRSFSATLSNMASASSRLSLAFSSSRPLTLLGVGHIHAAELRFPFEDNGVAHAMLAAQVRNRNPASSSFSISIICSSVNRPHFILRSSKSGQS